MVEAGVEEVEEGSSKVSHGKAVAVLSGFIYV
jgi:hypothetical protein